MNKYLRFIAQVPAYALFVACVAYLSTRPAYDAIPRDQAMIKLSFTHAGQRVGECRQFSAEEIADMPPNMRRPSDCPRERHPVTIEFWLDGAVLLRETLRASGLQRDGTATIYRRFTVSAGGHELEARLRDSDRSQGFDYQHRESVHLRPQQNLVVDFKSSPPGFVFQ